MRECSQCLSDVPDESCAACPSCGAPLAPPDQAATQAANQPDGGLESATAELRRFRRQFEERAIALSESALRRAERALSSAETQLRRATIMLVDLCGFSRMGTQMNPEELSQLAARFYKICSDCILSRGGFVVKFIGDAVLSVFGAPVAFDRDTENAVYAAIDIRERFRQLYDPPGPGRAVSIGLATGEVRSGVIETPAGKTYDIIGDTVNLAARLQGQAGENQIFVCARTREATERQFDSAPTAPLKLKNISDAYIAYRILDEKPAPAPRRVFESSFFGREKELEALRSLLVRAPESNAPVQTAIISGEAGLGKSRLVHEAIQRSGVGDRTIRWEASPAGAEILLHPVMEWLRREMRLAPDAGADDVELAIRAHLGRVTPRADDTDAQTLEYVFGTPRALQTFRGVPPERIQRNLFAILRELILAHGGSKGVVLIVDDVQWLDALTLKFLEAFAAWTGPAATAPAETPSAAAAPSAATTLILIFRTGAEPPAISKPAVSLNLQPLSESERQALLGQLVGTNALPASVRDLILSRGAGNPFFLEELTRLIRRALIEQLAPDGESLKEQIASLLPVSLVDVIQSRIDRLDLRTRQVLQCASLLGVEFAFRLIQLFDVVREGLDDQLQTLRALRYLDELAAPDPTTRDILYYFVHGLYRDVAYATMLDEQKRALHLALAQKLETAFADRLREYQELLAYHYAHGGDARKAIYYLIKAADHQAGLGEIGRASCRERV